ncbi:Disease resistance protein [Corchorus capsularis]|uniref:Disease resistance protein n=1 Tax=Corchorus capsularis TaxID=210143 RepID=A0A1R3KCL4_COCAP|nr:Disease resistance protein [Corchorus capsularis]
MAESIAFDLASGVISKLGSVALQQIALWWNLNDDLDDLKSIVSTVKAVLLDAEDNSMSGNKLTNKVRIFFSSSNQFAYGLKIGGKIKSIKARFDSIERESRMLQLVVRDRPVEATFMAKRREQGHSFVSKGEIIGRDDDKKALLDLMLESEEDFLIILIVGIGGLGKTALAQLVYNDDMVKLKDHFELRMWVCVSDVFNVKIIVQNIIKSVTNCAPDANLEMDQLQKQLRDIIDGKKYLLVLDDVWNEERENWFALKKLLMGGARGSRIIVTTRSQKVVKITGSSCQPHVLKGLSDDDAWVLFKEIAFEQRPADLENPSIVEIGKKVLEKCGGVPLIIRTIAATLSLKETEKEWLSFKDNELGRVSQKEGEILPTLKLSYDHLPSHLKHCFAYSRLYPKDYEIDVQTLIQLWIAQGFVLERSNPNVSVEDIGFGLNVDMVQHRIHKLKHLRYLDLSYNFGLKTLPESICKIQKLEVLNLDACGLEKLPENIGKLVNLTHLRIGGCGGLTHMPRGIGKLTSLETLSQFVVDKLGSRGAAAADLSELNVLNKSRGNLEIRNLGYVKKKFRSANLKDKAHLQSLSLEWGGEEEDEEKSLEDLQPHPNLEEFRIDGWRGDARFPSWFSSLSNLTSINIEGPSKFKTLPTFHQLPRLQMLSIFELSELEYMEEHAEPEPEPEPEPEGESELFFPSLTFLRLAKCPKLKSWWRNINDDPGTTTSRTLTFPPCLSYLEIQDCPLTSMPLYPSLQDGLTLRNCSLRPLEQTIQLQTSNNSLIPLSKLKSFDVVNTEVGEGVEFRVLDKCLQNLTSLDSLSISSSHWLDSDNGKQLEALRKLSSLQLENYTSLRELTLLNVPKCRHLPEWLHNLSDLERLRLFDLPNLTSLPDEMQRLTNLKFLAIGMIPRDVERI